MWETLRLLLLTQLSLMSESCVLTTNITVIENILDLEYISEMGETGNIKY